jgi:hypothetical protein
LYTVKTAWSCHKLIISYNNNRLQSFEGGCKTNYRFYSSSLEDEVDFLLRASFARLTIFNLSSRAFSSIARMLVLSSLDKSSSAKPYPQYWAQ